MKVFALRNSFSVQTGHFITYFQYYQGFAAEINGLSKIRGFSQCVIKLLQRCENVHLAAFF